MAKRENWVKLDVAQFCIEVFKNSENLSEWTKSLAESLAYNDPSKNQFGAMLLSESESFRDAKSKAARKRWGAQHMQNDAQHMQNDAQHMQNDANTSNDVMLCSVLYSSDLNDLEKVEEENDTACARKCEERVERQITPLESTIGKDPSKGIGASEIKPTAAEKTQSNGIAGEKRQKSDRIGLFTQDFESWWSRYPKKTGKQAAFVAWRKTGGALPPIETMLSALDWQSQCQQWTKDGGQYVPNPATYINQMRWLDEPPQTQAQLIEQGRQSFEEYMMEQQRLKNGQH